MTDSSAMRDKMYEAYLEFFEIAECRRRWNIFEDVPWDQLNPALNNERKATRIETYCAEEFYLPDYTAGSIKVSRELFGGVVSGLLELRGVEAWAGLSRIPDPLWNAIARPVCTVRGFHLCE